MQKIILQTEAGRLGRVTVVMYKLKRIFSTRSFILLCSLSLTLGEPTMTKSFGRGWISMRNEKTKPFSRKHEQIRMQYVTPHENKHLRGYTGKQVPILTKSSTKRRRAHQEA